VNRKEVSEMLQRVLQAAPFSMRDWANEAGVTYHAFRSWAYGKRMPAKENIQDLATSLRSRAAKLEALAGELDGAAGADD
jgi:hypothetical protein